MPRRKANPADVPESVRKALEILLQDCVLQQVLDMGARFLNDLRMREVWSTLGRAKLNPLFVESMTDYPDMPEPDDKLAQYKSTLSLRDEVTVDFTLTCLFAANPFIPLTLRKPQSEIEADWLEVAALASKLRRKLGALHYLAYPETSVFGLAEHLLREREPPRQKGVTRRRPVEPHPLLPIFDFARARGAAIEVLDREKKEGDPDPFRLPDVLDYLAARAKERSKDKSDLPRKTGGSMERTMLLSELISFVKRHYDQPLNRAIAVATAVALGDDDVVADAYVRRLRNPLK